MIDVLPSPDNVVAIHMRGTVTGDDYQRAAEALEAKLDRYEKLGVFVDMTGFDDLTPDAAEKDLHDNFRAQGERGRFAREAVITNKQWIRSLVTLMQPMFPEMEVRTFAPAEREEALAWVSDVRPH